MKNNLYIPYVGIRDGEFIKGEGQSKGIVLKIKGFYPPYIDDVNKLDDLFIRDLMNSLSFFRDMDVENRRKWLTENATSKKDLYLNQVQNLKVKFIAINNEFFAKHFGAEAAETLSKDNANSTDGYWSFDEIMTMWFKTSGKKGKTLMFRPYLWTIDYSNIGEINYNGLYVDIDRGYMGYGQISQGDRKIEVIKITRRSDMTKELAIIADRGIKMDAIKTSFPENITNWFTPSTHKSLIQKIIRTGTSVVEYGGTEYPAQDVLVHSFSTLINHQGSFVPEIQKFVTGLEAGCKRLGVSILEDSWAEDVRPILSLLASGLLAKYNNTWFPRSDTVNWWLHTAIQALNSDRIYKYDFRSFNPNHVFSEWTPYVLSYVILGELKSFESDISMFGDIAKNNGIPQEPSGVPNWKVMNLTHCIDHHTLPGIVHYFNISNTPYYEIVKRIWDKVTGINPKRGKIFVEDDETLEIKSAQRLIWMNQMDYKMDIPIVEGENYIFSYTLDQSQISGMLGPHETRVNGRQCIVVMRTNDINSFTAVVKPSRESKEMIELTPDEIEIAVSNVKSLLRRGFILTEVPKTLEMFKHATLMLYHFPEDPEHIESFIIQKYGEKYFTRTEEALDLKYSLPRHSLGTIQLEYSLIHKGEGVRLDADTQLDFIINNSTRDQLQRVILYLGGYKTKIELYKVNREGIGSEYVVSPLDTYVNHMLSAIANFYPAALVKSPSGYKVKNGPLMWKIRDKIYESIDIKVTNRENFDWGRVDDRIMWEHQKDSVEQMLDRRKSGKTGNLLWITVGLGKTLIVMRYILEIAKLGLMPSYCVYTLPPSAIDSVMRELFSHGFKVKNLDSGDKIPIKGVINIISHDNLKYGETPNNLRKISGDLLFIVDEFHKALNPTKRTSIIIEIITLSSDFIGLSGTIIKDTNYVDLIKWLEKIVEFEVTVKNYWVALGALVSKKIQTKVIVRRKNIEIPLEDPELYYSYVSPKLGGTALEVDFPNAYKISQISIFNHLLSEAIRYLESGEPGVFIVVKDVRDQNSLYENLSRSYRVHRIGKIDGSITLTPDDVSDIRVVITTPKYAEGYTLTKFRVMLTGIYAGNQATRDQLEGRLNRIGQTSPYIIINVYHTGILTYLLRSYETARTLNEAIKGFAKTINVDPSMIKL